MPATSPAQLRSTFYFDHDHPALREYGEQLAAHLAHPIDIAIALYQGVRDDIRYNPYTFNTEATAFSASNCLQAGESYCIPKAILLGALARAFGIPSRLGLADVKNHLASPQFLEYLRSDVFVMHGYTELYLEGRWVKATPAFDHNLCKVMGVAPLAFNGREDSIFHAFDAEGARHMEYLADHGQFDDVPHTRIVSAVIEAYPHLAMQMQDAHAGCSLQGDLEEKH